MGSVGTGEEEARGSSEAVDSAVAVKASEANSVVPIQGGEQSCLECKV